MRALGWTLPGEAAPDGLATVDLDTCAVVVAADAAGAQPRDLMRLQIACARHLPAFLPLAPNGVTTLAAALDTGRTRSAAIAARLEALRGLVQVSLRADWSAPSADGYPSRPTATPGRGWLAARAEVRRRNEEQRVRIAASLRAVLAAHATRGLVERNAPTILRLDALMPAEAATPVDGLADALAGRTDLRDARLVLTGPWPALAFADLPEAGPC